MLRYKHTLFQNKKFVFLQNAPCLASSLCMLWFWLSEPCMQSVVSFFSVKYQAKFCQSGVKSYTHTYTVP